jgi:hypothetical protein
MRLSRPLPFAALSLALVAIACGSAHDDASTSTDSQLTRCPPGQELSCGPEGKTGNVVCACVATRASTCSTYASVPDAHFLESWAMRRSAACSPIRGNGGTWWNLWAHAPPPAGTPFIGVPSEYSEYPPISCTTKLGQGCCTYVWWPDNFPSGSPSTWQKQDPSPLCQPDTIELTPITKSVMEEIDGGTGGSTCAACALGGGL